MSYVKRIYHEKDWINDKPSFLHNYYIDLYKYEYIHGYIIVNDHISPYVTCTYVIHYKKLNSLQTELLVFLQCKVEHHGTACLSKVAFSQNQFPPIFLVHLGNMSHTSMDNLRPNENRVGLMVQM